MVILMMEKACFSDKWRKWIWECRYSITYKILINGSFDDQITSSRGIRQVDPISLIIFLLCVEDLFS